jgi:outer membrane protein OmpA-like peptidoglycan-associated protein
VAGGSGKDANYWPGFVDALANVVVTMIFVVVVFTIALLYFSQNKVKEAIRSVQTAAPDNAQTHVLASAAVLELQKRVAELQKENDTLRRQSQTRALASAPPQAGAIPRDEIRIAEAAPPPGPAPAQARIQGTAASVQILFPTGTIELDQAATARLESAFAKLGDSARTAGIELVGIAEVGPYSEGRRLSYYRNLALRNWLIERGVPAGRIRMRIADVDTGRPEGIVQLSTAQGG